MDSTSLRKGEKMRRSCMKNGLAVSVVVLTLVLGLAVIASANTGALADFNAQYPGNSFGSSCMICHTTPPTRNPYGTALANAGGTANNIDPAVFVAVEPLDSDGDGFTNIEEINAGTFPGNPNSHPSAASITLTAPIAGELVPAHTPYTILYDAPAEVASVKVKYSLDNGVTWLSADGTAGAGSFDWNVPTPTKNQTKVRLKVIGYDAGNKKVSTGKSDAFTIEVVSITAPVADEIVAKGTVYTVTWDTIGTKNPVDTAKVFYTIGSTGTWKKASGTLTDPLGSFDWNVPSPAKSKIVKLKVVLEDASGATVGKAVSDAFIVE
jgi:hypothetical protein